MDENNPNTRLNPTDGHMVVGVMIDDHYFIGRARAAQLFQFAPDPRETEKKRVVDARKELQDLLAIRQEVQRLFAGAKAANVPRYADYITSVHKGQDGITPPIILYSEQPLKIQQDETGAGWIQIPWDRRLVAIDGETQLAARFEAANRLQETRDAFVPLVFCHGRKQSWARQAFHDLNVLAVKPNPSLSLSMDARDPLTKVACEVAGGRRTRAVLYQQGQQGAASAEVKRSEGRNAGRPARCMRHSSRRYLRREVGNAPGTNQRPPTCRRNGIHRRRMVHSRDAGTGFHDRGPREQRNFRACGAGCYRRDGTPAS